MADGLNVTPGSGAVVATDEVTGLTPTLSGTSQVQYTKLADGTPDSVNKALVGVNGALAVMPAADYIVVNGVASLVKRAFANVPSATTDSNIITAVAGKKLLILQVFFAPGASATSITFNSKGAGVGTPISPLLVNDQYGGAVLGFSPMGWFQTNSAEALTATTTTGSNTGVLVGYAEV
jgi:hypothetical protein